MESSTWARINRECLSSPTQAFFLSSETWKSIRQWLCAGIWLYRRFLFTTASISTSLRKPRNSKIRAKTDWEIRQALLFRITPIWTLASRRVSSRWAALTKRENRAHPKSMSKTFINKKETKKLQILFSKRLSPTRRGMNEKPRSSSKEYRIRKS